MMLLPHRPIPRGTGNNFRNKNIDLLLTWIRFLVCVSHIKRDPIEKERRWLSFLVYKIHTPAVLIFYLCPHHADIHFIVWTTAEPRQCTILQQTLLPLSTTMLRHFLLGCPCQPLWHIDKWVQHEFLNETFTFSSEEKKSIRMEFLIRVHTHSSTHTLIRKC